ncbi:hypothetical protein PanWU01x14_264720 [Parasponia andersonii]|uniref:Transmembrane protein n=1 Tax=Parasponia andersonii TaxID=3476 RepID=A0A2P5B7B4_PARAD|nr:hypothetical protein PanWU01x14_264720 [Parasponia andersonii]
MVTWHCFCGTWLIKRLNISKKKKKRRGGKNETLCAAGSLPSMFSPLLSSLLLYVMSVLLSSCLIMLCAALVYSSLQGRFCMIAIGMSMLSWICMSFLPLSTMGFLAQIGMGNPIHTDDSMPVGHRIGCIPV